MAKTKKNGVNRSDEIRKAHAHNPQFGPSEIRDWLKEKRNVTVSSTLVSQVLKKKAKPAKVVKTARVSTALKQRIDGSTTMEVILPVPADGLTVKLRNGTGALGTFLVDSAGFVFIGANGKRTMERGRVSFERAAILFESGLLTD